MLLRAVTGWTSSPNFPTASPFRSWLNGPTDAYISRLTPDGSTLLYSTFFGNQGTDSGNTIAVGARGDVSIAGETIFPIAGGNFADDAFVVKLHNGGSQGTSYTSLGSGVAYDIATDGDNTYVTGITHGLQPVAALQPVPGGDLDAFVVKVDSFARIVYATYLGGSGIDIGSSIAVDAHGNCIIAGMTASADFPTVNPLQGPGGEQDIFVANCITA